MLDEYFSVCISKDACPRKDCLRNYTPTEKIYTAGDFCKNEDYDNCQHYIKPLTYDDIKK